MSLKQGARSLSLKQRQREAAIRAILESAEGVFAQHGYHRASMDDIAKACECAPATLYGYFKGKAALFGRMVAERTAEYMQGAAAALDGPTFDASLDGYINNFIHFGERNRAFVRVMIGVHRSPETGAAPDPEMADVARRAYVGLVERLMERGVAEGALRPGDPHQLAVGLLGLVHAAAADIFLDDQGQPLAPAIRGAVRLFRHGAAAPAATEEVA
jgi:AcrR family transcriptional regulator